MGDFNTQEVANTLWAFAVLNLIILNKDWSDPECLIGVVFKHE